MIIGVTEPLTIDPVPLILRIERNRFAVGIG